jgi:uncharacterized phage protein (TIGR02216 family)
MHVGFCLLRLSSRQFWALTPIEFFVMTGGMTPPGAVTDRAGLEALMQAFPDGDVSHPLRTGAERVPATRNV